MINRVVPAERLEEEAELVARQIAQAPLSVLMGIKAGVKQAWEGMGMRTHLQSQIAMMQLVGRADDVAAWRAENAELGLGPAPRKVARARAELAAEQAAAAAAGDEA